MTFINKQYFIAVAILLASFSANAENNFADRFTFSGFGQVVAGYLDESDADYQGYSNSVYLGEQSLFAVQADFTFNSSLSVSGQLLAHSASDRDSGVEWLYLNYEPSANWRFKLGKLRTPFFRYSDVIDVGFAYPWISAPQQVYSGFLFSNYEGASATYLRSYKDYNFEIEAYYGVYSGSFSRAGEDTPFDVDEIKGLIFSVNHGNLNMRISTIESSDFDAEIPDFDGFADILEISGFIDNANAFRFDGKATAYQANINYDTLDYFAAAEAIKITSDVLAVPELTAYYATAGYNFHPFQVHITYSTSKSSYNVPENQIPVGIAPQIDQLSYAYDLITSSLPLYNLDSVTFGARWDVRHNIALKAELTLLYGEDGEGSFYSNITDEGFDRKSRLYQLGVEWYF
ncbi:hypothetical protein ACOI22_09430 [Glaciecola sp. 2405UD65-10]|uniref:hypothetical protein n=1 Tax=Glaciecola sp. 2405UD65-10 TaxID=3397244 RepID=UPI003B5CE085